MRHFRFFLLAFAIMISINAHANPVFRLMDENSVSVEIEGLLKESCFHAEKDFTVTVFFSISDDRRIQSLTVASPSEAVNEYLQKRLANQELPGDFWRMGKIYEVSFTRRAS